MNAHRKNIGSPPARRGLWVLIGSLVLVFGCNILQAQLTLAGARFPVIIVPLLSRTQILTPQPVPAGKVKCGETLTKDTKLDGDVGSEMDPCPNDGLIIGKDDIKVDLNGYTIWGVSGSTVGVRNPGFDEVEIKNGVIKGFGLAGVFLEGPGDKPIEENEVKGLTIETPGRGIWLEGVQDTKIEDNVILGVASGTPLFGIIIEHGGDVSSDGNEIEDNLSRNWNVGIGVEGNENRVKGNNVDNNSQGGIQVEGDDNVIEENLASAIGADGNEGYGIRIKSGEDNVVRENTAAENSQGGILVEAGSKDTRIESNTANHNGTGIIPPGDGIRIEAPKTTVKKNIACNNGGFGIFAVPGVDDDGGNKAKGNGNPDQCSKRIVKCSAKTNCQSSSANLNLDTIPESQTSPEQFTLIQNYPNPFNPETEIRFRLPKASSVVVRIYNLFGQEIRTLVNKTYPAGLHSVHWDGRDNFGKAVASGVYFYQLQAGSFTQVKKMNLLR